MGTTFDRTSKMADRSIGHFVVMMKGSGITTYGPVKEKLT